MTVPVIEIPSVPDLRALPQWRYRRDLPASFPSNPRTGACSGLQFRPYFAGPGSPPPVGRPVNARDEAASVTEFLDAAARQPSALLIDGEPGIGKTTLWLATHDEARQAGFRVLSTRASEAESLLDFVGLDDLLGDVEPEVLDSLPVVGRQALEQVLIRAGGPKADIDRRSVAAAFMSIIEELAVRTPVLLAVDDVQWIDAATRDALAYALRRVRGRIGIVVTERTVPDRSGAVSWLDLGRSESVTRLTIAPMPLGRLHRLMSSRTGRSFPRSTMARIAEISGGNPYYALELAHALDTADSAWGSALPSTLTDVMGLRVGQLDEEVHEVLLAAACVTHPTLDLLAAILRRPVRRIVTLLEVPENRGIVVIDGGQLHFSHPLLAHVVYSQARPADRRRIHRTVAGIEPVLERQARHMALAATTGDPETLLALDSAADAARAKASPAVAAELLELAIGLGGGTATRRVNAAHSHLLSGDVDRALALLEPAASELPEGPLRARARVLLGGALSVRGDFGRAVEQLHAAVVDAADDPALTVRTHLTLAITLSTAGDAQGAARHAQLARTRADEFADRMLISQALAAQVLFRCANGQGVDEVSLQRAIDLEQRHDTGVHTAAPFSARIVKALVSSWTGRLTEARGQLIDAQRHCAARGSDVDMLWVQSHAAMVDIWLGRHRDATQITDDMLLGAEQLDSIPARALAAVPRGLIAALEGREADARAEVGLVLEHSDRLGETTLLDGPRMVLGFLELSLGQHAAAVEALHPLLARSGVEGHTEIASWWFLPDLMEAAFALGRTDEFEPWVDALEDNGARLNRPWMIAIGARCRTMLLAARGEIHAAEEAAARSLEAHDALPMPFERARTQLVVGQLQRRLRQKHAARVTLADALATFEGLGASLWADRARAELGRAAAGPSQHILTPSELRVAELVASGMTNRDVAAAMYISPKTVEHNLGRIYRKLGIRGRAELGRQIDTLREVSG